MATEIAPMTSSARGRAIAGLAAALPRFDVAVTVVAPTTSDSPARWGLARRLRPLVVEVDGERRELALYDGTIAAGRAAIFLVDCDGDRAWLCAAALELAKGFRRWPDAVHATDVSVAAILERTTSIADRPRPRTVASVHDRALPAAIATADVVIAPCREWARQIAAATPAVAERVRGVLPGLDVARFDPRLDAALPARFGPDELAGKAACKSALQRALGLPRRPRAPLITVRCEADDDAVAPLLADGDALGALDAQLVLLVRDANRANAAAAHALAGRFPTRIAARADVDDDLDHLLYAGADFAFDPTRLDGEAPSQLVCWRYGALPIIGVDSGLADVVVDFDERSSTGSGLLLAEHTPTAALHVLSRAIRAYGSPSMTALAQRAMSFDLSWKSAAATHAALYRDRAALSAG